MQAPPYSIQCRREGHGAKSHILVLTLVPAGKLPCRRDAAVCSASHSPLFATPNMPPLPLALRCSSADAPDPLALRGTLRTPLSLYSNTELQQTTERKQMGMIAQDDIVYNIVLQVELAARSRRRSRVIILDIGAGRQASVPRHRCHDGPTNSEGRWQPAA